MSCATRVAARRQRVDSAATIGARRAGDRSVLHSLEQRGGARISLPRSDERALEAVLVNTAGGLTGGDSIDWSATALDAARLTVSTAAAEKVYRSEDGMATQRTRLHVGPAARLDWLPQETIVYQGGRLSRTLEADLAGDATLLVIEPLVFGRQAMGERLVSGSLHDRWRIRRDGELLHAEALRIEADRDLAQGSPAGFGERYRATLSAVLCSTEEPVALAAIVERLRRMLPAPSDEVRVAVSALPGRIVLRALARDGYALRRCCLPAIEGLLGSNVPRVWHV